MPLLQIPGSVSVFNVDLEDDGTYADYLGLIQEVTLGVDVETVDAEPINREYTQGQPVGKSCTLSAPLMSVKSGSVKVSQLDVSAFTLLGNTFSTVLQSGSLNLDIRTKDAKARADLFSYHQPVGKKTLNFDMTMGILGASATAYQALMTSMFSTTPGDVTGDFSLTINSIAMTFDATITKLELVNRSGDFQVIRVSGTSYGPDSGAYPDAPTGTTTILERALNTITRHRLQFTPHGSEAGAIAGNGVLSGFGLNVPESGLVYVNYEWKSQGAWTWTGN